MIAFTDRNVVVTGAASGIGLAVRRAFDRSGASVVGLDVAPCDEPDVLPCDLTDEDATRDAFATIVDKVGSLDVVVAVAGGSARPHGDGSIETCTAEGFQAGLQANLMTTFHTCRLAIGALKAGSAIVTVSSVLGLRGGEPELFDTSGYAAAKGGILSLTRAMAMSLAPRGIRVNCVAPGLVRTPMSTRAEGRADVLAHAARRQPLVGSFLEADQVAGPILFLASDLASGITGVVLPVDGGWTAS